MAKIVNMLLKIHEYKKEMLVPKRIYLAIVGANISKKVSSLQNYLCKCEDNYFES